MKKIKIPLYSIISLFVLVLFFTVGYFADKFVNNRNYLYTGLPNFTIDDLRVLVAFIDICLLASAIIVFLLKNIEIRSIRIASTIVIVIISVLAFLYIDIGVYAFAPKAYVELVSDDGKHQIVIAEDCYFFSIYGGNIFEKTSPHVMKKLQKYEAEEDFFTPFSDGNYSVIWNEENFELFYDSDADGEKDKRILVEYLH